MKLCSYSADQEPLGLKSSKVTEMGEFCPTLKVLLYFLEQNQLNWVCSLGLRVYTKSEFCTVLNKSPQIFHKLHEIYFMVPNTIENHNHLAQPFFWVISESKLHFISGVATPFAHPLAGRTEPGESSSSPLSLQGHSRRNTPGRVPLCSVRTGNKNFIHQSSFPPLGWSFQELCCLCLTNHFPASSF